MVETPVLVDNSSGGGGGAAAAELKNECGEEGEWNSGGNRWPHEETLALLKIRSEMDIAFRDSAHKGHLWDQVSRKMGELGYHRNGNKCKEKFENIYKYHKRIKEGRCGRQNGKNYRFFEQLEGFDSHQSLLAASPTSLVSPTPASTSLTPQDFRIQPDLSLDVMSTSTSSSSQGTAKKKRKLGDYFYKLMKKVVEKQEGLHNNLLEAIEKCDKDRMAREQVWKRQEMEILKREQESIAQERAIAAAKDAAIIAFLHKITPIRPTVQFPLNLTPKCVENQEGSVLEKNIGDGKDHVVNDTPTTVESCEMRSSRWPKEEVEALIRVRTSLDLQYQDNGSKGSLWEEISAGMNKFGYERSAKRCKEKWENINKYYRRVKETQKKRRPEDSKTCPYFHMLDSVYQNKSRRDASKSNMNAGEMLMSQNQQQQQPIGKEDGKIPSLDQNQENDRDEDDENIDDYEIVGSAAEKEYSEVFTREGHSCCE